MKIMQKFAMGSDEVNSLVQRIQSKNA